MFDKAPFHLNKIMSVKRYREISAALQFTDVAVPIVESKAFLDCFNKVCKMIGAFNQHYYTEKYHPSWLNILKESMSSASFVWQ